MRRLELIGTAFLKKSIVIAPFEFYPQTFWASTDYFTIADVSNKTMSHSTENTLNIIVGESDIFSMAPMIRGDIVICDIDIKLLQYINDTINMLRDVYAQYKEYSHFKNVKKQIRKHFLNYQGRSENDNPLSWTKRRLNLLGSLHYLSSEERFVKCMESLSQKEIVTININLFANNEQQLLAKEIDNANYKINVCNLTNLPDYDDNDKLKDFLQILPWSEDSLIMWNIHDRGPYNDSISYSHYLFTATNVTQYSDKNKKRPEFFADVDWMNYSRDDGLKYPDLLRRYTPNNRLLQETNKGLRTRYLQRIMYNLKYKNHINIIDKYQCEYPPRKGILVL